MAPFNKYLQPTNDPTYLGYSHEIAGPTPNLAYSKLFSGIGEGLDAGIKGGTQLLDINIEDDIKNKLAQSDDAASITPDVAAGLGKMKNKAERGGTIAQGSSPVSSQGGGATLLAEGGGDATESTPPVVKEGISKLDRLYNQYQSGQLSPTYYLTQQQVIAQQLYQKYPGSEKEIRSSLHEQTRSANEIRSQVYADFQAAATAANTSQKDWEHYVRSKAEYLGPEGIREALSPSTMNDRNRQIGVTANIAQQEYAKQATSTRKSNLDLKITESTVNAQDAERNLTLDTADMFAKGVKGAMSPLTGLQGKINDWVSGAKDFTEDDLKAARGQVAQMRQVFTDAFRTHVDNPRFEGNQSYNSLIPDKSKINAIFNSQLESLDYIDQALNNKDPKVGMSLVGYHLRDMESRIGLTADQLIIRSETARALAGAQKAIGGDGSIISKVLENDKNLSNRLGPNGKPQSALSTIWQDVLNQSTAKLITPPPVNGPPTSIADPVKPQQGEIAPKAVYKSTLDKVETILTDPTTSLDMRKNTVGSIVRDTEGAFFKELDKPSQLQAYGRLTSPQMSKAVNDLGDPKLFTEYKAWSTKVLGTFTMSRAGELKTLLGYEKLNLQYDPKTNQLVYDESALKNFDFSKSATKTFNLPELQTVNQLNSNLNNISNVYKHDKSEPSTQFGPLFNRLGIPTVQDPSLKSNQKRSDATPDKVIPGAQQHADGNWYVKLANGSSLKINV